MIDFPLFSTSLSILLFLCSAPQLFSFTMHLHTLPTGLPAQHPARSTTRTTLCWVVPPPAARQMARTEGPVSTPSQRSLFTALWLFEELGTYFRTNCHIIEDLLTQNTFASVLVFKLFRTSQNSI